MYGPKHFSLTIEISINFITPKLLLIPFAANTVGTVKVMEVSKKRLEARVGCYGTSLGVMGDSDETRAEWKDCIASITRERPRDLRDRRVRWKGAVTLYKDRLINLVKKIVGTKGK